MKYQMLILEKKAFDLELSGISDFNQYKQKFYSSFVNSKLYPELVNDPMFNGVFNLQKSDGDNIVNNQSQLGLKFDYFNGKLLKRINSQSQWVNIDTFLFHSLVNSFHVENQHRKVTTDKVIECLQNR